MRLRDIGARLPPGFRFHPRDEELVCHYLFNKINAKGDGEAWNDTDLLEIDLHVCEPWQLPDAAKLSANEWYFFSFRDRKYTTGYRTNRATTSGYWKATGKDRTVLDGRTREIVGMRKTLVFYKGRAPHGIKTSWIMHEFRLETPNMPPKENWVLCRVFNKSKSAQDNTITQQVNLYNESQHNYSYAPQASSSSPPPSSTIDHHPISIVPNGSSDPLISPLSQPPHLEYTQSQTNCNGNSLLTQPYQEGMVNQTVEISSVDCGDLHGDDYGRYFWDMAMEKTCVGSTLEDDLRFDIDNTNVFQ